MNFGLKIPYRDRFKFKLNWPDLFEFDISSLILNTSQVCRAYVNPVWLQWLCHLALPNLTSNCALKWPLTHPLGCINFSKIWRYLVDRLHVLDPLFSNSGGQALFGGNLGNHRNVITTKQAEVKWKFWTENIGYLSSAMKRPQHLLMLAAYSI